MCTYHAVSPPGSEQERLEYALNNKRRALILALRWANTHSYLLQEEPAALSFLEVNLNQLWAAVKKYYSNCVKVKKKKKNSSNSVLLQELYGSLSNDSRVLRALKDFVPDLEKIVQLQ